MGPAWKRLPTVESGREAASAQSPPLSASRNTEYAKKYRRYSLRGKCTSSPLYLSNPAGALRLALGRIAMRALSALSSLTQASTLAGNAHQTKCNGLILRFTNGTYCVLSFEATSGGVLLATDSTSNTRIAATNTAKGEEKPS